MNANSPITEHQLHAAKLDLAICLAAAASLALLVSAWVL